MCNLITSTLMVRSTHNCETRMVGWSTHNCETRPLMLVMTTSLVRHFHDAMSCHGSHLAIFRFPLSVAACSLHCVRQAVLSRAWSYGSVLRRSNFTTQTSCRNCDPLITVARSLSRILKSNQMGCQYCHCSSGASYMNSYASGLFGRDLITGVIFNCLAYARPNCL